jgi:hypothetical protein
MIKAGDKVEMRGDCNLKQFFPSRLVVLESMNRRLGERYLVSTQEEMEEERHITWATSKELVEIPQARMSRIENIYEHSGQSTSP